MIQGRLQGRVALITGGSRGIGKASAVKMMKEGASVVLLDILSQEVSQAARELKAMGGNALRVIRLGMIPYARLAPEQKLAR